MFCYTRTNIGKYKWSCSVSKKVVDRSLILQLSCQKYLYNVMMSSYVKVHLHKDVIICLQKQYNRCTGFSYAY